VSFWRPRGQDPPPSGLGLWAIQMSYGDAPTPRPGKTRPRTRPGQAHRLLAALLVVPALLAIVVASPGAFAPAGADPIADKRAEAARLADKIDQLNERLEVLYEDLTEARNTVAALDAKIAETEQALAATEAESASTKQLIRDQAIQSYMAGFVGFEPAMSSITSIGEVTVAEQYTEVIIADSADSVDALRELELIQNEQRTALQADKSQADAAKSVVEEKVSTLNSTKAEQQQTLNRVKGEVATLVAAEQARREEAARRASAAAAARRNASVPSSRSSASIGVPIGNAPAPNPRVAAVLAEARAQLGKPYSFGASGDDAFDCSGFTSWVWGAAGVGLPHSSRAQLGSVTRIDASQAQPGDLIFYGSPIHHVSLYVGNGQVIHAPHSGTVVSYGPAFRSNMVAVGRVN